MVNGLKIKLQNIYSYVDGIYTDKSSKGYWSNINKKEQEVFLSKLNVSNCLDVVKEKYPELEGIIFDPDRAVGLRLLDINPTDIGIDYGCMWGNLLVHAAKCCKIMVGVDQTIDSLKFLNYRLRDDKLNNCFLVNANLREDIKLRDTFDFSIVNGVLEWVADKNEIEHEEFYKKKSVDNSHIKLKKNSPRSEQLTFLKMVCSNLKKNGLLYLAIENRYDYQYYLWKKDPHSNIFFTAFLPRCVANIVSNLVYGRPYVNYLYSHTELEKLLKESGFSQVEKYVVFPDYRYPQKIISWLKKNDNDYQPVYKVTETQNIIKRVFRIVRRYIDVLFYKKLKLFNLAPSFIFVAKK